MFKNSLLPPLVRSVLSFLFLITSLGCEKTTIEQPPVWSSLRLLDGMTQLFEFEEIRYEPFKPNIRSKSYLKVLFTEDKKNENQQLFKVAYYSASAISGPWKLDSLSMHIQTPMQYSVLVKNSWQTKLLYPIFSGQAWPYFIGSQSVARVSSIHSDTKWQELSIPLMTEVVIREDSSLIHLSKHIEWYSPKYGLLATQETNLQYCEEYADCIGLNLISYGYERKITRVQLGHAP